MYSSPVKKIKLKENKNEIISSHFKMMFFVLFLFSVSQKNSRKKTMKKEFEKKSFIKHRPSLLSTFVCPVGYTASYCAALQQQYNSDQLHMNTIQANINDEKLKAQTQQEITNQRLINQIRQIRK